MKFFKRLIIMIYPNKMKISVSLLILILNNELNVLATVRETVIAYTSRTIIQDNQTIESENSKKSCDNILKRPNNDKPPNKRKKSKRASYKDYKFNQLNPSKNISEDILKFHIDITDILSDFSFKQRYNLKKKTTKTISDVKICHFNLIKDHINDLARKTKNFDIDDRIICLNDEDAKINNVESILPKYLTKTKNLENISFLDKLILEKNKDEKRIELLINELKRKLLFTLLTFQYNEVLLNTNSHKFDKLFLIFMRFTIKNEIPEFLIKTINQDLFNEKKNITSYKCSKESLLVKFETNLQISSRNISITRDIITYTLSIKNHIIYYKLRANFDINLSLIGIERLFLWYHSD